MSVYKIILALWLTSLIAISSAFAHDGTKALGATNRSIRVQVLCESLALCAVAGVMGIIIGFSSYELLIWAATKFVPNFNFEWAFEPLAAFISVASILAVGIASGFVPALRAEKLQVIEALRSE